MRGFRFKQVLDCGGIELGHFHLGFGAHGSTEQVQQPHPFIPPAVLWPATASVHPREPYGTCQPASCGAAQNPVAAMTRRLPDTRLPPSEAQHSLVKHGWFPLVLPHILVDQVKPKGPPDEEEYDGACRLGVKTTTHIACAQAPALRSRPGIGS